MVVRTGKGRETYCNAQDNPNDKELTIPRCQSCWDLENMLEERQAREKGFRDSLRYSNLQFFIWLTRAFNACLDISILLFSYSPP